MRSALLGSVRVLPALKTLPSSTSAEPSLYQRISGGGEPPMEEQDRLKAFPSVTVGSTCIKHQAQHTANYICYNKCFRHHICYIYIWYIRFCKKKKKKSYKCLHKPATLLVEKVEGEQQAGSCSSEASDRFRIPLSDIQSPRCRARSSRSVSSSRICQEQAHAQPWGRCNQISFVHFFAILSLSGHALSLVMLMIG